MGISEARSSLLEYLVFHRQRRIGNDACDFDLPIPSMKLQLAVSKGFDTLR
jgi:hypothetical protein